MPDDKDTGGPEVIKDQRRKVWFDTRISVTDIITIVLVAIGLFGAYATLDKRISILETMMVQVRSDDADSTADRTSIRREMKETREEISRRLERIDDKLDRIMDRNNGYHGGRGRGGEQ